MLNKALFGEYSEFSGVPWKVQCSCLPVEVELFCPSIGRGRQKQEHCKGKKAGNIEISLNTDGIYSGRGECCVISILRLDRQE